MGNRLRVIASFFVSILVIIGIAGADDDENNRWEKEIRQFEQADSKQFPPEGVILFIGSSSIRMWKTLDEDFAPLSVINRGFGGSQIEDSIHFADRIIIPYKPSIVVLYAGDNDVAAGKTPDTILQDFERFAKTVKKKLPDTQIMYLSIKPSVSRWKMWNDMKKANELIKRHCIQREGIEFVDVSTPMLDENGRVLPNLFLKDNLHLNALGYSLWTSIVKPRLLLHTDSSAGK